MTLHRLGCSLILVFSIITSLAARDTARSPRVDFATYLSGNAHTNVVASAIDSKGYLYVIGTTEAADFPTTSGAFRRTPRYVCTNGSCRYWTTFVAKLSRDGSSLIYSTFLNEVTPLDIAVDASGNAYATGGLVATEYTGTAGAWRTKCNNIIPGEPNQFCRWIAKLNATGSAMVYSSLIDDVRECFTNYDERVAVNAAGELYVAGTATAFSSPATGNMCYTTPNAFRKSVSGSYTGTVVMKFNASGSGLIYSTWVSGPVPRDEFHALAVTPNDRAVIVGNTINASFPTSRTAFQRAWKSGADAYIAKLSPDGSQLLASTLLGGTSIDDATSVAVDSDLNVYVAGTTWSPDFPTTAGAYKRALDTWDCGGQPGVHEQCPDVFVTKLPPDFSRLTYSTYFGGRGEDYSPYLAIDRVGHVFLTGTPAVDFPLVNPIQTEYRPFYIAKLNTNGTGLLFSSYWGGTLDIGGGFQWAVGLDVDEAGNPYTAWNTESNNVPTTPNAYQTFKHSNEEAGLLVKFDIPPCRLSSTIPSVTICAPVQLASVNSPVLIGAGASDDRTVTAMVVYVDGVSKYAINNASHFDTKLGMTAGAHHLTVKAWDSGGRVFSSGRDITVQ